MRCPTLGHLGHQGHLRAPEGHQTGNDEIPLDIIMRCPTLGHPGHPGHPGAPEGNFL